MKRFYFLFLILIPALRISAQINEDSSRIEKLERKVDWLEQWLRQNAIRLKNLEQKTPPGEIQNPANKDSSAEMSESVSPLSISGYVDGYYAFYTDSVGEGNFQKFPTISPRSNSLGLNIAMLNVKYATEKIRATVTLHYGDLALSTWSTKYNVLQEVNAGIRLSKKLWLDVGFFKTHVGTEAFLPKDNFPSSVAVGTFYEPYFESGFRLNYNPTKKLSLNVYGLNGYNIFEDNNHKKSVGLLATYTFSDHFNINYSNYFGDDSPDADSLVHKRFYNNFYLVLTGKKIKFVAGGDYCLYQHGDLDDADKQATMYSALASFKYKLSDKFGIYGRGEKFDDRNGFLSGTFLDKNNHMTGLTIWGATAGVEFNPTPFSYIRIEGRKLQADRDEEIFHWEGTNTSTRMEIMMHLGISF